MSVADHPSVQPKNAAEWRRWLRDHHATASGVWLVAYKRATGRPQLDYEHAVREALCWGWIDSLLRPIDAERAGLLYTPRRPGSGWSRTNKERVRDLVAAGRMRPAGLAKIEAAKRDGSWTLLDSVEALAVPADLRKALGATGARKFGALGVSARKQHLYSLVTAKRPETRARRIAEIVRQVRG